MATKYYTFKGKAVYPMLRTPDDFNGVKRWKIGVKLDEESEKLFKESGLRLRPKFASEKYGLPKELDGYYVFSRPTEKVISGETVEFDPPEVENWDGHTIIGNGSEVEVVVDVYDTRMGKGHRLRKVKVLDLVPFDGDTKTNQTDEATKELDDEVPF